MNNPNIDKSLSNIQDVIETISRVKQYYKTTCRDYDMDNEDILNIAKQHHQKRKQNIDTRSKSCINKPFSYNFSSKSDLNDLRKYYPVSFNDIASSLSVDEIEDITYNQQNKRSSSVRNNERYYGRKSKNSFGNNNNNNNKRLYEDYSIFKEDDNGNNIVDRRLSCLAFEGKETEEEEEMRNKKDEITKTKLDFSVETGMNIDNISDSLLNAIIEHYDELLTNPNCLDDIKKSSSDRFLVNQVVKYLRKIEEDLERRDKFNQLLINIKENRENPPSPPPLDNEEDDNINLNNSLEQEISDILSKENFDDSNLEIKYNKNRIGKELAECFSYVFNY